MLPPWLLPLPLGPFSSSGSVLPVPDSPLPLFARVSELRARQAAHTTLNTRERGLQAARVWMQAGRAGWQENAN
jgi:hypothetical protein